MIQHNFQTGFPISQMMDQFLNNSLGEVLDHVPVARPKTNITEHEDAFQLEMTVPGLQKEQIKLEVVEDTLNIEATVEEKAVEQQPKFFKREFQIGSFTRSFKLPKAVNTDEIAANYKNGILTVTIPKMEEVTTKKMIEIN